MHELPRSHYHCLASLVGPETPGRIFLSALLEGNHQGRIFVDKVAEPSTWLVTLACEFNFVLGRAGQPDANAALRSLVAKHLAPDGSHVLLIPTSPAWEEQLPELFGDARELIPARRMAYELDADRRRERQGHWAEYIPEGYVVRRYDRALAEGEGLEAFWGSIDAFLERGFGFAVVRGSEVVSRCHTVFVGNGAAEISVATPEAHRRQGFATLAASAFIDHCLAEGLGPVWSCWDNNTASQRLAEHLGFVATGQMLAYVIRPA